ncbi:MAG: hypothetical protein WBY12_13975, partial [Hyphomicrobium sp.]
MTLREHLKLSALCLAAAAASGTVVTLLLPPAHVASHPQTSSIIRSIPVQTSSLPAPRLKPGYSMNASVTETSLEKFGFVPLHAT